MAEGKPKPEEKGRFIVERQYVDDRRIHEPKKLDAGGVDISGRWGVLIEPRTITDFDHSLMHEVQRQKGGEHIHRCFQCGNCTAACPTAEETPAFHPRYFIHAVRMGWRRRASTFTCAQAAGAAASPARARWIPQG